MSQLSIGELKAQLLKRGVDISTCLERQDLEAKLKETNDDKTGDVVVDRCETTYTQVVVCAPGHRANLQAIFRPCHSQAVSEATLAMAGASLTCILARLPTTASTSVTDGLVGAWGESGAAEKSTVRM